MTQTQREVRELRRLIGQGKIQMKDVYYLIIQANVKELKNREAQQSRFLHDNHYQDCIAGLCHNYMLIEYPNGE